MSSDQKPGELFEGLEQHVRDLYQSRMQTQFFEQIAAESIVTTSCVAHQYGALMRLLIDRGMNGTEAHTLLEKMHHSGGYGSWNVLQAYLENLQDAERRWAQGQKTQWTPATGRSAGGRQGLTSEAREQSANDDKDTCG